MIYTADRATTDGVAFNMLSRLNVDIPILLLSRRDELDFNEQVLELEGKEYICVDYIENGWDVEFTETLVVGKNIHKFPFLKGYGWQRLNEFMRTNPPKIYFKRELLEADKTSTVLPIEYPNWQSDYPIQPREFFDARPISALNFWGRSHEGRLMLHGEIWKFAARNGGAVCDNIYYLNSFLEHESSPLKLVTLNIEHYSRIDISEIMKINQMSKLSISLPGCGIKCFRSTGESVVNSVMVLPFDDLAYSYPLIHNGNCIMFKKPSVDGISKEWDVMGAVKEALANQNLYDIYLEGKKIADFYRVDNYIHFLKTKINNVITQSSS